jgi:hypothetical protein
LTLKNGLLDNKIYTIDEIDHRIKSISWPVKDFLRTTLSWFQDEIFSEKYQAGHILRVNLLAPLNGSCQIRNDLSDQ